MNTTQINDTPLTIAGKQFTNRFLLGTGKFKNKTDLADSIALSETEIVTVALRRIDLTAGASSSAQRGRCKQDATLPVAEPEGGEA